MKKITTFIVIAMCFATTLFAQGNFNIKFKNGYDFNIQRNNIDSIKFDASNGYMLIHQFGSTYADSISIEIIDTLKFNMDSLVLDETPPDSFNIAIENAPDTIVQIEDIILDNGQSAFDFLQNIDPGWMSDAPYSRNFVIVDASFLNSQDQRNLLISRLFDVGRYLVTDANHTHGGAQPNGLAYVYGGKKISVISRPSPPTNPSSNTTCAPDPGCDLDTLYGLDCSGMVSLMAKLSGLRVPEGNCTILSNPTVWNGGLTASSSHNFDKLKYIAVPGPIPPSQLKNGDIIFLPSSSSTGYEHMGIVLSQSGDTNIKVFESHGKSYLCPTLGDPCTQNTTAGRGPRMVNINTGTLFNQLFGSNFLTLRLIAKPMLGSSNATNVTYNSALVTSIVTYSGGDSISQGGFCWSTAPNPTTSGNVLTAGIGSGSFSSTLNGLTDSTTYYVRAFATNNAGTAYGTEISFITLDSVPCTSGYSAGTVYCAGQTAIVDVTNPATGKIWMDRNLGATQAATSSTDAASYGDLYQWGRRADGHQCLASPTTSALSSIDQPTNGSFILSPNIPYDWRSPQSNNLWQGVNGVNNPCPCGYRLPTEAELVDERLSWSSNDAQGAFSSPLKLPMAGFRVYTDGSLNNVGTDGFYWSSTINGIYSRMLSLNNSFAAMYGNSKANGYSVRCIKD
jgi:uncharacterized protein (TIGR02145 family)